MLSALAKYVINRLMHGLFHIAFVISPQLISSLGPISRSRTDNKGNMKKAMYYSISNIIKKNNRLRIVFAPVFENRLRIIKNSCGFISQ